MFSPADGADSHHGILVSAEVFTCTGSFILIFSEVALRIFNWSPSVNWHQPGITVGGLSQPSPCTKWKYTPDGVRAHYRMHNSHWGEFTAGLSNVQPAYDPPHTEVHTPQVQQLSSHLCLWAVVLVQQNHGILWAATVGHYSSWIKVGTPQTLKCDVEKRWQ